MKTMAMWFVAMFVLAVWSGQGFSIEHSAGGKSQSDGKLLQLLPHSSVTLSQGIPKLTGMLQTPLSAKFELNSKGELCLSVCVSENWLAAPVAMNFTNTLKEITVQVDSKNWKPVTKMITDQADMTLASAQWKLLNHSHESLVDALARAQTEHKGATMVAIAPVEKDGKDDFVVRYAKEGQLAEAMYPFKEGKKIAAAPTSDSTIYGAPSR
jgi:hypothetical protein